MTGAVNRRIVLASRPTGEPQPSDFRLETGLVPEPEDGQVLLRTMWLSLDPYMRGRMSAAKSYAKPVLIDDVMVGGTVSEVVVSRHPDFQAGDIVLGHSGWQEYALSTGGDLRRLDPSLAPVSTALGILGMPGMTAYTGLVNIGQPKAGETLVVAAASGPVGSAVGQIAKLKGCRVVGVAGGPGKCRYLIDELGFDAAVDHRFSGMAQQLRDICPNGIDIYFENVGGAVWDAVFPLLNDFARVPVCGLVAHYNDSGLPQEPDRTPLLMRAILTKRLNVRGFIVGDFASQAELFQLEVSQWLRDGQIRYREDVVEGLENAPEAFMGMLKGRHFGKLLVRITH
jgi:NADPH-dependent curcumin reductase CurA